MQLKKYFDFSSPTVTSVVIILLMEVFICSSKDESALCTLAIPNILLYQWYLTRKDGSYSEKLNDCVAGKAMMLIKPILWKKGSVYKSVIVIIR